MSLDRREGLLAQLVVVAESIPGIKTVLRNQTLISATRRPAIILIDGDEVGQEGAFGLGRPASAPSIMSLMPQLSIMVGGSAETVGSDLNAFRLLIIPAVQNDSALQGFVGQTGGIQYQGCVTDLGHGQTTEGLMVLTFALHYPLIPQEMI